MLNKVRKALEMVLLVGAAQTAAAATYDFSHTFTSTGKTVGGTFEGTTAGDFVVDISNIHAAYDGRALAEPLYAYQYDLGWMSAIPVVSFDVAKHQFIFINCPHFECVGDTPGSAYNYFNLRHANLNEHVSVYFASDGLWPKDDSANSSWNLVERAPAVPEPATSALMVGGLAALSFLARRRRQRD